VETQEAHTGMLEVHFGVLEAPLEQRRLNMVPRAHTVVVVVLPGVTEALTEVMELWPWRPAQQLQGSLWSFGNEGSPSSRSATKSMVYLSVCVV
jgi:hypothetical protein